MIGRAENRKGFTLVELLVTLSIMSILVGIMAPKISALFQSPEEKTAARFRHALMRGRWLAARDQVPVFLVFDKKAQKIYLFEKKEGKEERLFTLSLPDNVKIAGFWNEDSESGAKRTLRFLPDGRGEGFGVLLEDGKTRLTVMGYPYRSGVDVVEGWTEGESNGA